ncbi:MAG: amidophosphoribosyltransferase [Saprospiraceae bacterium]|jgi:amidophosphoribosyltransferase|nr:amidophosphoribosyltransferase [Saprospiraceae bacterium]MBP9195097.1 amidophosphoribosyltransferase [Saprospiraceae bacterium]
MSDQIKHECGLAMIRLLKPLEYYHEKYGTALYGINKLQLLLQKQRNRGQDGAGVATIKFDIPPGNRYISRHRSIGSSYLKDLFDSIYENFNDCTPEQMGDMEWLKKNKPYIGELLLGHLRYGTHGANNIETVHPFLRQNNWISRNLVCAGNFNLTNIDELFNELLSFGQYPKEVSDTVTVMEKIGHFLDDEVQRIFDWYKHEGYSNIEINKFIEKEMDIKRILTRSSRRFDGGYVIAGLIGHGDAFVLRDPAGIRPAFYYHDDEICVVASERPALQTCLDIRYFQVKELQPGSALIIKKNGEITEENIKEVTERKSCTFERIYFSRGTDRDIYLERKNLGRLLAPRILEAVNHDFDHTIFSFIPNTAEVSFFGLIEGLNEELNTIKTQQIAALEDKGDSAAVTQILNQRVRSEKLAVKDEKLRTFIADDGSRNQLVSHIYDVTYGIVQNEVDTIVLIDDSIVRGTTLRDSIIYILSKLRPKRIIIVSSAPQIRYPDCYGIDMSRMSEFIAFKATIDLLQESGQQSLIDEVYKLCKEEEQKPLEKMVNHVKKIYEPFTDEEISARIAKLVTADGIIPQVDVIFQTVESLHVACPNDKGDWYFTGDYPTLGGVRVVNRAFINYIEDVKERSY